MPTSRPTPSPYCLSFITFSMEILLVFNLVYCHPQHMCRLCGHPNQTTDHLLAECPLVWRVWTLTLPRWLPQPPNSPSTLLRALYALDLPPSSPSIDSYHVLDGVLAAVWKAYWRQVFDNIPFTPVHVSDSVDKTLHSLFSSSHLLD
ncbi:hypothetical protein CLU79DRAFT_726861 [Phycomyces nitens]|nr:hypothetical protein CLU79DRAFT_726861 [Phycomyces nitens]